MIKKRFARIRLLCFGLILSALLLAAAVIGGATSDGKPLRVRMALSESLFQDLNENDARAAVRVWADSMAEAAHLDIEGGPQLLSSEQIVHAIATHQLDGFSITTNEYMKVIPFVDPVIFTDEVSVEGGLEYVLLVRSEEGIHDLAGLRGRSLLIYQSPSMSLAAAWLETLLAGLKLDSAERFFARVKPSIKVSQTVLPVYFGSADACLVTRRAFDTMSELNPQLRRKLLVLAISPKLLAAFFGVQKDAPPAIKARIHQALIGYYDTPKGRQILTLFQSGRLVAVDTSVLRVSVDLLAGADRARARHAAGGR